MALNFEVEADNTGGAIKSITFVGNQTGTFASATAEDGTVHAITDDTNVIDIVYQIDVGGSRAGATLTFIGYLNTVNDTLNIQAYDFVGSDWETRGILDGQTGAANVTKAVQLLTKHTGTSGADNGKVLIRFQNTGLNANADLQTDQLVVSAEIRAQSAGYAKGSILVDDSVSNTNTEDFVDGTADNPVSTWAAALTLNASLGLKKFEIVAGTSITLTANSDNFSLNGNGWTLALGGQSIEGASFCGADITGIGVSTSTHPLFARCHIAAATIPPSIFHESGFGDASGTFTAGSAGEYVLIDCFSQVPGSGTPALKFDGLGSATGINNRRWSGGASYTLDSDCTLSHEVVTGGGTTVITGGADVEIRGITRALTLTLSGAGTVQFVGIVGPVTISGAATTVVNLYGVTSSVTDTSTNTTVTDSSNSPAMNADALLTRQMTEAYAADGTAPTLAELLFMVQQMIAEIAISGTTMTVKKLDGSTVAATFTLDSAENPTSRTRAT